MSFRSHQVEGVLTDIKLTACNIVLPSVERSGLGQTRNRVLGNSIGSGICKIDTRAQSRPRTGLAVEDSAYQVLVSRQRY